MLQYLNVTMLQQWCVLSYKMQCEAWPDGHASQMEDLWNMSTPEWSQNVFQFWSVFNFWPLEYKAHLDGVEMYFNFKTNFWPLEYKRTWMESNVFQFQSVLKTYFWSLEYERTWME